MHLICTTLNVNDSDFSQIRMWPLIRHTCLIMSSLNTSQWKNFLWYHAESLSSVFGQPVLHFLLQNSKLRKRTIHNNDYFSFRQEPCVKYTNNICHTCTQYLALHGIPCKDNFINRWQLAKMKKEYSWHVPAIKFIGMKQLVSKVCKYTWKITKFVKMGNLGQYHENLIFCQ